MTAPIDPADPLHDARGHHLRHDGWTPDRRRDFLAHLADGHTVEDACRLVGKSASSAYALRRRADGAAFALGWRAAALVARDHLADTMLGRALHGVTDSWTRADGTTVERHRHDNRLGMTLLRRLDAQVDAATPGDATAARLVAGDFDAFLALVASDAAPARAGLFLAARLDGEGDLAPIHALARADRFTRARAGTAAEIDVADLDPAARADWTADQWLRAEAAGLVALAPAPGAEDQASSPQLPQLDDAPLPHGDATALWWDDELDEWRTSFPPPLGFDGDEEGMWDDEDYHRSLTAAEADVADAPRRRDRARRREVELAKRDAWLARGTDAAKAPSPLDSERAPAQADPAQADPAAPPPPARPDPDRADAPAGIAASRYPGDGWGAWRSTPALAPCVADADRAASPVPHPAHRPPPRVGVLGTPPPAAR